jgi:hypothetical protein
MGPQCLFSYPEGNTANISYVTSGSRPPIDDEWWPYVLCVVSRYQLTHKLTNYRNPSIYSTFGMSGAKGADHGGRAV